MTNWHVGWARLTDREARPVVVGFLLYVAMVWFVAAVRYDYMWIIGDDPYLLLQAHLMALGYVPNVEFPSGYPGLHLPLHAALVAWLGPVPLANTIYTALYATAEGAMLFTLLRRHISPWLIFGLAVFLYAQVHFQNAAPNPGFGSALLIALGLLALQRAATSGWELRRMALAGVLFGLSLGFKQYGIFGPVMALLFTSFRYEPPDRGRGSSRWGIARLALLAVNVVPLAVFEYGYVYRSVLAGGLANELVVVSAVVYPIPWIIALAMLARTRGTPPPAERLTWGRLIGVNSVFGLAFVATTVLVVVLIHREVAGLADLARTFFLDAPDRINTNLMPFRLYNRGAWVAVGLSLLAIFAPPWMPRESRPGRARALVLMHMVAVLAVLQFPLGATLFIVLAFSGYLAVGLRGQDAVPLRVLPLLALAPFYAMLVPWPVVTYHLMLTILFGVLATAANAASLRPHFSMIGSRLGIAVLVFTVLVYVAVPAKAVRDALKSKEYQVAGVRLRSHDVGFAEEFARARAIIDGSPESCKSAACSYAVALLAEERGQSPLQGMVGR